MIDLHYLYNNVDDLVLSILICMLAVWFANFLRRLLFWRGWLSSVGLGGYLPRLAAVEMIGTMECAVMAMELNVIIYNMFGPAMYTIMTFVYLTWQDRRSHQFRYYANPSIVFTKFFRSLRGSLDGSVERIEYVAVILLGEFAGVSLGYEFITRVAWKYSYLFNFWKSSNYHASMGTSWGSQLHTSTSFGMMVEGGFSFMNYMWPKIIRHHTSYGGGAAHVVIDAGKAIFSGVGAPYTGGIYNPIIACALEYPSGMSSSKYDVYWVAPIIGSIVGSFLH